MITLTLVLAALVILTTWDASEAEESAQLVPIRTDDESAGSNR